MHVIKTVVHFFMINPLCILSCFIPLKISSTLFYVGMCSHETKSVTSITFLKILQAIYRQREGNSFTSCITLLKHDRKYCYDLARQRRTSLLFSIYGQARAQADTTAKGRAAKTML